MEISAHEQIGCIVGGEPFRIGAFDQQLRGLELCFVGSRVSKGELLVNQNISSSFDPATLICIACEIQHPLGGTDPISICITDQNFLPNLSGGKNCVGIIRLENGSLKELTELALEVFSGFKFPAGSVLLIGSATHLHRVGVTLYALDWNGCTLHLGKVLANVQICPLIPLLGENIPGTLGRELVQITGWLEKMYEGSILGLKEVWALCAGFVATAVDNGVQEKSYTTVALPSYLGLNPPLAPFRFVSSSSCHINANGLSVQAMEELTRTLLSAISKNFGIKTYPEDTLVREHLAEEGGKGTISSIVLVGASNMRRVYPHLESTGLKITLCPLDGQVPSEKTLEKLGEELAKISSKSDVAVVLDLLGNTCFRFEQPDGTMAVPIMLAGRYHLLGNVGVISDENLKIVLKKVIPVLDQLKSTLKVIIPPIPRYIGGGCCQDSAHAPNSREVGYAEGMLGKAMHLRKVLRDELKSSTLRNYWVPDIVAGLVPEGVKSVPDMAAEMALLCIGDNVHLTHQAYGKLAGCITSSIEVLKNKKSAAVPSLSGPASSKYFWRGFISCRGSIRMGTTPWRSGMGPQRSGYAARRGGHHRGGFMGKPHPYQRGGRR